MITFDCAWPARPLWQNASGKDGHWRAKAKAVKAARSEAFFAAIDSGISAEKGRKSYTVVVTFSAPDNRRRDKQNMPATVKAHIDGIADALGVDDNCFNPVFQFDEPGRGRVTFSVGAPIQEVPIVGVVVGSGTVLR